MKLYDLISMAFKNLTRRKLRASLTILGVVIGATSIIIMLSIGVGLNQAFEDQFSSMASLNTVQVYPNPNEDSSEDPVITDETLEKLMKIPEVKAVMPITKVNELGVSYEDYSMYPQIVALKPEKMKAFDYKIAKGRLLESDDELQVVVGATLAENMYDSSSDSYESVKEDIDLYGEELSARIFELEDPEKKPDIYDLEVVGVLEKADYEKNQGIFMNMDYYLEWINDQRRSKGREEKNMEGYKEAWLYFDDMKNIKPFIDEASKYGVKARSAMEFIEQSKKQMAIVQACLGGIGGISLLVAAIGITNTMIMSTYERTKEIGVMKVIGSNIADIKRLFLVEAAFIGFFGGLFGLLLSALLSAGLNVVAGAFMSEMMPGAKISVIPTWLMILSLVFSTAIGIISGYLPAKRAMKLSALKAIRTQ